LCRAPDGALYDPGAHDRLPESTQDGCGHAPATPKQLSSHAALSARCCAPAAGSWSWARYSSLMCSLGCSTRFNRPRPSSRGGWRTHPGPHPGPHPGRASRHEGGSIASFPSTAPRASYLRQRRTYLWILPAACQPSTPGRASASCRRLQSRSAVAEVVLALRAAPANGFEKLCYFVVGHRALSSADTQLDSQPRELLGFLGVRRSWLNKTTAGLKQAESRRGNRFWSHPVTNKDLDQ
jgi:hypothetical protein